ncbi:MAG: YbhB/YbcL family Raf kinase inhibitor-like protein [Marinifilaceae bacterium]
MGPQLTLQSANLSGQAHLDMVHNQSGGKNMSPPLSWTGAPTGTKSFAVTMYDPDAPTGSGFWHWCIFDLPENTNSLPEDAGNVELLLTPGAIQAKNDTGSPGYTGCNPPPGHGWHAYMITVYALDCETLGLTADASPGLVGFYLWMHTIEKASIVFYFKNK